MPDFVDLPSTYYWLIPLLYAAGIGTALDAVMQARTPQGATAWVFALIAFPLVTLPLYWIFGRTRFGDYTSRMKEFDDAAGDGDAMQAAISEDFLRALTAIGAGRTVREGIERYRDAGVTSPCVGPIAKTDFDATLRAAIGNQL